MALPTAVETAKDHSVSLRWRYPAREAKGWTEEEWAETDVVPPRHWYVACVACCFEWPVTLTRAGKPIGADWWLCLGCLNNLSGKLAKRYLGRFERGEAVPEGITTEACVLAVARDDRRRDLVRTKRDDPYRPPMTTRQIELADRYALEEAGLLLPQLPDDVLLGLIEEPPPPRDPLPVDLFEDF